MRNALCYLNTVLTVIAVLLALHLWALWAQSPLDLTSTAQAQGTMDAGTQRMQMIELLRDLNRKADQIHSTLQKGVKVEVQNWPKDTSPAH